MQQNIKSDINCTVKQFIENVRKLFKLFLNLSVPLAEILLSLICPTVKKTIENFIK